MSNFKRVESTKEDAFEEFIFRVLGSFDDGNTSCDSVVADFMRKNNFSDIKAGEIDGLIDKLCELASVKGDDFSNRVCDELSVIGEMTELAFKKVSNQNVDSYIEDFKREAKNSPHESAQSIGRRLLGLN